MAMWDGRFKKEIDVKTNDFNSSIHFDKRMYKQDILGSIAHSKMLAKQGAPVVELYLCGMRRCVRLLIRQVKLV